MISVLHPSPSLSLSVWLARPVPFLSGIDPFLKLQTENVSPPCHASFCRNAEANAEFKNLDTEKLFVEHVQAVKKSSSKKTEAMRFYRTHFTHFTSVTDWKIKGCHWVFIRDEPGERCSAGPQAHLPCPRPNWPIHVESSDGPWFCAEECADKVWCNRGILWVGFSIFSWMSSFWKESLKQTDQYEDCPKRWCLMFLCAT